VSSATTRHIYLDANVFIRFLEAEEKPLLSMFARAAEGALALHTSELTLAEVLVKPFRDRDFRLAEAYRELVKSSDLLALMAIDRTLLEESAMLRSWTGNKLADSIHVATAKRCGCAIFLSEDARLKLPDGMLRMTPSELEGRVLRP